MISSAKREVVQQEERERIPMRRSMVPGLTASILLGVIFETYPATRAAQLNPVEALQYD